MTESDVYKFVGALESVLKREYETVNILKNGVVTQRKETAQDRIDEIKKLYEKYIGEIIILESSDC